MKASIATVGLIFAVGAHGAQLCEMDANYMPNNIADSMCLQLYANDAELADSICLGGMKFELSMNVDYNGDGQTDIFCYYPDVATSSDCDGKFPNGLTTCHLVIFSTFSCCIILLTSVLRFSRTF